MKSTRKLLCSGLVAALIFSVLAFPSLGTRSSAAPATARQEPVLTGQLVQGEPRDEELSRHFRKYDLIRMDPARVAEQVRNRGRLLLKSSSRDFDLQLTPYDMRSADYTAQVIDADGVRHKLPKTEVNTYKGEVKGSPDAQARISLTDRGVEGAIITKQGRYFLQPARSLSRQARTDEFVLYDGSDVTMQEDTTCGVTLADEVAAQQEAALAGGTKVTDAEASGPITSNSPMKIARIATDADGEYVAAFGGAAGANAQIASILNFVDGIYQSEIGMSFQIVQQNAWADATSDPYTSTAAGTRLTEFRNYWNANLPSGGAGSPARSIAHLFTGVNLDGSTIGIASFGVSCRSAAFSYGLSQRFPLTGTAITAQTVVLTAHEIGHNFGAAHTNQPTTEVPADIELSCDETIMEASVGNGSSFCPFSRSQIVGWVNAFASCLVETATPPPTSQDCTTTPLPITLFANGSIAATDCRSPSRGVDFFADRYSFSGIAGERLFITMVRSSGDLDPYLYLIGPDGYFVAQDDDGGGVSDSRIPITGSITLPYTGVYVIEATSFLRGQTGSYTVNVLKANCSITVDRSSLEFPATAANGTINVSLSGCSDPNYQVVVSPTTETWVVPEVTSASGTRSINVTVQPNTNQAGRRAFLLIGAVTTGPGPNDQVGGLRIPILQSGTAPDCGSIPIAFGQTINGNLSSGDCHSPVRGSGFFADHYSFNAAAGQRITIQATSGNMDTFLTLLGPNGVVILNDDDSGGGQNSRIPGGANSLPLGLPGPYIIEVTAFSASATGSYSLTLTANSVVANTIQLSQPAYSVGEGAGFLNVNVTRSGDISGAANVNFATSDAAGLSSCTTTSGNASERCDYATTAGTLRFAAGETSKGIIIPIVNDALIEGNENFNIALSGATGGTLGTANATITIVDNDSTPATQNPIDDITFFVTQQYIDFLGRLPDATGLANWVATLSACPNGGFGEFDNPTCDRVHVSSGFFLSPEFQGRGYFAYRFYEVALDRRPTYAEFVPDMAQVGGAQSPESEVLSKAAYTDEWMQRSAFKSRYDGLSNAAYVNALEVNAEVVVSNKAALIAALDGGTMNRGQVLRNIVESQAVASQFFNRAFVSMQYFGYLRRDPDAVGFQNWVNTLNADPTNSRHMIFGFLFSTEYRQRFGP
ncbi:MAG TPA: M12 family metallo-peptidase [Pyrinomonadaceae bacterium]|nr:M12 family metallo-peptidase [Pyrinomonadaceae bacterium]